MIVRQNTDVAAEDVLIEDAEGVKKRVLISKADGAPNFIMRQFSIAPGGHTPYHSHSWEHEVYVLSGTGEARTGKNIVKLSAGTVILVLPDEEHNFTNTGKAPLIFLCTIPG